MARNIAHRVLWLRFVFDLLAFLVEIDFRHLLMLFFGMRKEQDFYSPLSSERWIFYIWGFWLYESYGIHRTVWFKQVLTRIGEGDRIGDGDDIRLICLSGFILSSTIAVKFEFLFHVQHTHSIFCIILYN